MPRCRTPRFALDSRLSLQIFARFDTSKDGFLDPTELRLALRVATNADVDLDTCKRMIAATDKNGDGVVDFKEFRAITKGNLKLP